MPIKVLIAAAGTGGHIFPGIAVAKEFRRRDPDAEIVFVGTSAGLETKIVPREGFELELIDIAGLARVGLRAMLRTVLRRLPKSLFQSWRLLRRRRPDLVIGIGGYVSGPVVLAAVLCGIPTMIIEPNVSPGLTNRILGRLVCRAAVSFPQTLASFGDKGRLTGNPVRPEFFACAEASRPLAATTRRHLLVFGGSQGAHAINQVMVEALPIVYRRLTNERPDLELTVTHQTGERDYASVRASYEHLGLGDRVQTVVFIDRMAQEFARADLIISRAGATTIAELTAAAKPAILIPLPTAADDHQRKNAEALQRAGAARCLLQAEATAERLAEEILTLIADPEKLRAMSEASRKLATPDAAARIVDLAYDVLKSGARDSTRAASATPDRPAVRCLATAWIAALIVVGAMG
ncbi:MAG TPA: undecaprenyldiphospho-muramoylpentapeptide beta-N-acetylglucosaminyltransferase [Blastocatellia bacterium]|nr:undecaprenyldiphospho-muramoylpentapeptide beta-N-acetylglucosaminyltransferase [Blastocatellia bacterium]